MGASDSKLVFKQGVFKLQDSVTIPADDSFWAGFWELPETTEDVFALFSANDIRRTRDLSLGNFETLILAIASRLTYLKSHPSFPHRELAPEKDILNCIRVLTRVLPFIYETDSLDAWEEKFFWTKRQRRVRKDQFRAGDILFDGAAPREDAGETRPESEEVKPLAEELIDTLLDLLFSPEFTIPLSQNTKARPSYAIWSSGVGCNSTMAGSTQLDSNRTEVLRLLLTLASKSIYMPANILPVKGTKALTYLVTCPDKQVVLSVLCSLLNTTIHYNPASWRIPYDHVVLGVPKHIHIATCLQMLLVLLLYPVPEDEKGLPAKNFYRHYLGRIHRSQDFQFVCDGISRTLHQPLTVTSSYLPGSQKPVQWAGETIMLFWEMIQCNKRFRSFIVDSKRSNDLVVLLLFYALENRQDPIKQGIVRMCIFVLQTLSVEENFGVHLNDTFQRQETLPGSIRIENWSGTYGDFLVVSIHTLITTTKGRLDAVYLALLAILNNVAAHFEALNALSCLKILQLFALFSSPTFLLANESNNGLLSSLLQVMSAIIEHKYKENPTFIIAILKSRRRFEALRQFTLETGQQEIAKLQKARQEAKDRTDDIRSPSRSFSGDGPDGLRSPGSIKSPNLSDVPEDSAFAVGGDDDSDVEEPNTQNPNAPSSATKPLSRTPSASSIDSAVPTQLRGMSEKARGKMPVGTPTFSRVNSTNSISSYSGLLGSAAFAPTSHWVDSWLPTLPLHTIITLISLSQDSIAPPDLPSAIEPNSLRVHSFEWSHLSLGWYESLLWSFIYSSEMIVQRGTVGVWNGTAIRLFKVEKEASKGPSLMKPMGAVDAVGSSIVQRIGSLNLRSSTDSNKPKDPPADDTRDV